MFQTLIQKLQENEYLTLETTPQHEPTMGKIIKEIKKFDLQNRVDAFSTTDNPLAKLKYNSILASIKLQQEFEKPVITTMSMRDRNKIALQSDLLGANEFNVRAILALTGDPAKMSDQPHSKSVLESNSSMLLKMIKSFNYGMDISGHPFKIEPKQIFSFAVTNSYSKSFTALQKKIHNKIQNGAIGIITQPVFNIDNAKKLLEVFINAKDGVVGNKKKAQLIFGVFPITKLRTALFLSAQVPGIHVPQEWIDKLELANQISQEEEYKVGMQLSKNLFNDIKKFHPKIHLMTVNKFNLAHEILA